MDVISQVLSQNKAKNMIKRHKSKMAVQAMAFGAAALLGVERTQAQVNYTIGGTIGTDLENGWNLTIDGATDTRCLVGDIKLTPAVGPTVNTVCTDVSGTVYLGDTYAYVTKSFAASPSSGIDPIWGADNGGKTYSNYDATTANAAIQNAAYVFASYRSVLTSGTLTDKVALQLAVWTALYDTGSGQTWTTAIASGRFNASIGTSGDTAAITEAVSWLNALLGPTGTASHTQYSGNLLEPDPQVQHGLTAQEMLLTPTPVPEPTTVLAGVLLLLPFGGGAIRYSRKHFLT